MHKLAYYGVLGAAFLSLGMSMPSCPGQQAMQTQIDTLTTQNADLSKRIQALEPQIRGLNKDMSDVKALLKPMADMIQAQKTQMDQFDVGLKELQAKVAAAKPAAKAAAGAKKRK